MNKPQITGTYIAICAVAAFLTFFFHELAHWFTGEALGNNMALSLNTAYPVSGSYSEPGQAMMISAAGPLFTVFQAIMFYLLIQWKEEALLYPFLFTPLYMRLLAGAMNFINLNDEGRISKELGIGTFTISFLVCGLLAWLVYKASHKRKLPVRFILITLLLVMVFSSALILADRFLHLRIL